MKLIPEIPKEDDLELIQNRKVNQEYRIWCFMNCKPLDELLLLPESYEGLKFSRFMKSFIKEEFSQNSKKKYLLSVNKG